MRRKLLLTAAFLIALWFMGTLYLHEDQLNSSWRLGLPHYSFKHDDDRTGQHGAEGVNATAMPVKDGHVLPAAKITAYLDAIFGRRQRLPTVQCPRFDGRRYEPLRAAGVPESRRRYFLALNLRNCVQLLPRLMGSIVEAIRFLGPENCALSIVEGYSPDGSADVLAALKTDLEALGVRYFFRSSAIDSTEGARISKLAKLRNMALEPLISGPEHGGNTTVLFLNDVAACPDDILELALQRQKLGADMTCGMDWSHHTGRSSFNDVWISRDIHGESFFRIPPEDGSWKLAQKLFWDNPESKALLEANRPFQVFACWNGGVAFSAEPLIRDKIVFRSSNETAGECFQGEPQLFCKDLWFHGYTKIAVVPTVNFEYTIKGGKKIKKEKGFASALVAKQDPADDRIDWLGPPENVRCMPSWTNQFMAPWNQSLG